MAMKRESASEEDSVRWSECTKKRFDPPLMIVDGEVNGYGLPDRELAQFKAYIDAARGVLDGAVWVVRDQALADARHREARYREMCGEREWYLVEWSTESLWLRDDDYRCFRETAWCNWWKRSRRGNAKQRAEVKELYSAEPIGKGSANA